MNVIPLAATDLALVGGLVLLAAALAGLQRVGVARALVIGAARTVVQLLLIGQVLRLLFATTHALFLGAIALVMLTAAGREVVARQKRGLTGAWGFGIGTASMFLSSFTITVVALVVVIGPTPWYAPQYAIPLLGMMLGNTMTGVALAMDRLGDAAWQQRAMIEQRLALGQTGREATQDIRSEAMRAGTMPIINAMAAAGLVSLPGMMTGQILAGSPPTEAVKYQILVMFLISSGTMFGVLAAQWLQSRRLFDPRHRLRLDRLRGGAS